MAPKTTADTHLSVSFIVIASTAILHLAYPHLSLEPQPSSSTDELSFPFIQLNKVLPKLIHLSYFDPQTAKYHKGLDDLYFIGFWIVIWLSLREILMKLFFHPLGSSMGLGKSKCQRFSEQGWTLVYCSIFWCMGIKILSAYPHPILSLNIRQYWQGYPQTSLEGLSKFYYLSQIAFWFQQIIVIQVEKRRKDYHQMFTHHIVTVFLVCGSYATNFTGIGTAVHTTMDFSDIFLAFAKMLNYLQVGLIGDATFLVFVVSWIYTRHYILIRIIFFIYKYIPQDIQFIWDPSRGYVASRWLFYSFLGLLTSLEIILIIWLYMIMKVLWKVVRGQPPEDTRSDSEDTDEDVKERKGKYSKRRPSEKQPLLKTVKTPERSYRTSTRSQRRN